MKKIATYGFLIFVFTLVSGCATTANYEKVLNSWLGSHVDRLVSTWGPPSNSYELSDGSRVLEYVSQRNTQVGGYTYTTPQTTYHSGTETVYGNYGGYAQGNYQGTSTTYVQRQTPVYNVHTYCITRFTTSPSGVITRWAHEGNACRANDPGPTTKMTTYTTPTTTDSTAEGTPTVSVPSYITSSKATKGDKVRPNVEPVGLYSEPSPDSDRINKIGKSSVLTIIEDRGEWLHVTTNSDETGWVMREVTTGR